MKIRNKKILILALTTVSLALLLYWIFITYVKHTFYYQKVILKKDMELKHFVYSEFDSKNTGRESEPYYTKGGSKYLTDSGKNHMVSSFMQMLDKARDIIENGWNKENPSDKIFFKITSGYRTPEHNAHVGGVPNSAHVNGKAADIYWGNYSQEQREAIKQALRDAGFNRMGFATTFIHVDSDETKPSPAEWTY